MQWNPHNGSITCCKVQIILHVDHTMHCVQLHMKLSKQFLESRMLQAQEAKHDLDSLDIHDMVMAQD